MVERSKLKVNLRKELSIQVVLKSSESESQVLGPKKLIDLRPNLVVFLFGISRIFEPLRLYGETRNENRSLIYLGARQFKAL